jgi:peptide/nickel transport system ATP-binding protein
MNSLININNLVFQLDTEVGVAKAIDGISLSIQRGKTLCLIGESGCGKSLTALSIVGLLPIPPGRILSGEIFYNRKDNKVINLANPDNRSEIMRSIRGKEISIIFQEPMTSLNPVKTIGFQITEIIREHLTRDRKEAKEIALKMLNAVRVPAAAQRLNEYPYQLSGGMRQRVMIAIAMSCNPSLLIADEPTTALDVTIQAQVLDLMQDLKNYYQTSILFITHDFGVVARMADYVSVMYLGKIVESAPVKEIFKTPMHPYTQGLLKSLPSLQLIDNSDLNGIPGNIGNIYDKPLGCSFHPRCQYNLDKCKVNVPDTKSISDYHSVACWLY